jgi:hypothetical protein
MALVYNGQALQDKFVASILKKKRDGYFVEIGAHDPIGVNNTYTLEHSLGWRGIMVEYEQKWLPGYLRHRTRSIHVIQDATTVDYIGLLRSNSFPSNLDYLQVDLDVDNRSTLTTLEILNSTVFPEYKFATITFEHDVYRGDFFNTRANSRAIFEARGYVLVYPDVSEGNGYVFEDWYVHPDLVDMDYVNRVKRSESLNFKQIMSILDNTPA